MGKRPAARQASPMWVDTADLPTSDGHPFFERVNRVLEGAGFDAFVEGLCAAFGSASLTGPLRRDSLQRLSNLSSGVVQMRIIVLALIVLAAGCATKLTTAGSLVREVAGPDIRGECEFLGIVLAQDNKAAMASGVAAGLSEDPTTSSVANTAMYGRRSSELLNQLRNKVAEAGGDAFLVVGSAPFEMQAESYRCGLADGPEPFEIVEKPA